MRRASFFKIIFFLCTSMLPVYGVHYVNDDCINESGKLRVLIATQSGMFKDSVMDEVITALQGDSDCVKVLPLGDLPSEIAENYQCIVIGNTCHFGSVSGKAKGFINKCTDREKKKVVLFTTCAWKKTRLKDRGVDAVSSASEMSVAPDVSKSIINKVRAILSRK